MNIDKPLKKDILYLKKLWKESFGDTDVVIDTFFENAFSTERCMCVFYNGSIAASLYWFNCTFSGKRIAYIYAISTAKQHRGKGFCRKLMEHTHLHLRSLGYTGAILVPASESLFGFYEKMGYISCTTIGNIECKSDFKSVDIREIGVEEYANSRRKFLPDGGVVQENENLSLLSTYMKFYSGTDFLLAAKKEEDMLNAAELLGNTSCASQIVGALGCKMGKFRIAGNDTPFSMYMDFNKNNEKTPSYFGLAFD